MDDRDAIRLLGTARLKWQATLDPPDATDLERAEARSELKCRAHIRGTAGNEQHQVQALRRSSAASWTLSITFDILIIANKSTPTISNYCFNTNLFEISI